MPRENEQQFLSSVLRGDRAAIDFCNILFQISQVLDDLIDGDKEVNGMAVFDSYWQALVALPTNPFYQKWQPELRPLIASALQAYLDSVRLERSDSHRLKAVAFVLRDQLTDLVVHCARLVGGVTWMREVSPSIREHFHEDELDDYIESLKALGAQEVSE